MSIVCSTVILLLLMVKKPCPIRAARLQCEELGRNVATCELVPVPIKTAGRTTYSVKVYITERLKSGFEVR